MIPLPVAAAVPEAAGRDRAADALIGRVTDVVERVHQTFLSVDRRSLRRVAQIANITGGEIDRTEEGARRVHGVTVEDETACDEMLAALGDLIGGTDPSLTDVHTQGRTTPVRCVRLRSGPRVHRSERRPRRGVR